MDPLPPPTPLNGVRTEAPKDFDPSSSAAETPELTIQKKRDYASGSHTELPISSMPSAHVEEHASARPPPTELEPPSTSIEIPTGPPDHPHPHHVHHSLSHREKYLAVAVYMLVATLLYADQNLMAPNLSAIAADLGLRDEEKDTKLAGPISAVFFVIGAPAAIIVGYLSGLYSRKWLFFIVVLLGEGPVIGTYWVKTYGGFFALRALTGLSLGGCFPLVFSLLGDLYGPEQRSTVSSVIAIATGAGTAIGQGIAGFCGPTIGWRAPFLIVGFPTIALALFMVLRVKEPKRGETERLTNQYNVDYDEKITMDKAKKVCEIPTNVLMILQGLPGSLPWGVILVFLTDFLAQDRGLSIQVATLLVLLFGLGGGAGVILGGWVGDLLYRRNKRWLPLWMGFGVLAGVPLFLILVNADLKAMPVVISSLIALAGGAVSSIAGPCVRALILNVNEPETRGVAVGLQSTLDDVGKGAGPALVAVLISSFGRSAAFNLAALYWIPCALLMLLCNLTVEKDVADMESRLEGNIRRHLDPEELASIPPVVAKAHADREHEEAPLLAPGASSSALTRSPSFEFASTSDRRAIELTEVASPDPARELFGTPLRATDLNGADTGTPPLTQGSLVSKASAATEDDSSVDYSMSPPPLVSLSHGIEAYLHPRMYATEDPASLPVSHPAQPSVLVFMEDRTVTPASTIAPSEILRDFDIPTPTFTELDASFEAEPPTQLPASFRSPLPDLLSLEPVGLGVDSPPVRENSDLGAVPVPVSSKQQEGVAVPKPPARSTTEELDELFAGGWER